MSNVRTPVKFSEDCVRRPKLYSVSDTFDIKKKLDNSSNLSLNVTGFEDRTDFVPEIDPTYVFPKEETLMILLGLLSNDRILLVGPTGSGKTSLIEQVAARLNYQVYRINFDGCITRADLVGEWTVRGGKDGGEMVFQYGILSKAFQDPGSIILLDEWDTISAECSFVLQRPLEKNDGRILITETGGELIPLHEMNRIVATANTNGQGDDTGLYQQGTKIQNYSQLNRFGMTVRLDYMPKDKEVEVLKRKFPELEKSQAICLVDMVNLIRDSFMNGAISVPLSPRDLFNWAYYFLKTAQLKLSAKYCFLNRMTVEDAMVVTGVIDRYDAKLSAPR